MRSLRTSWMVLVSALSMAAACGGGGGGDTTGGGTPAADHVSYAIGTGTTTVRTETYDLDVPLISSDPYVFGNYVAPSAAAGSDKTFLYAYSQYSAAAGFAETISVTFRGNTTGGFPIGGANGVSITWPHSSYIATAGTITVDTYESVGGRIHGTYSVTNATSSPMSGSFSVTREADQ